MVESVEYFSDMCVVCLDGRIPKFCIQDCGHVCLCRDCAKQYKRSGGCPLCRQQIRGIECIENAPTVEIRPYTEGRKKREKLHQLVTLVTAELGFLANIKSKTTVLRFSLELCDWNVEAAFFSTLVQTMTNAFQDPCDWRGTFYGKQMSKRTLHSVEGDQRLCQRVTDISERVHQHVQKLELSGDASAIKLACFFLHECVTAGLKLLQDLPTCHQKLQIQALVDINLKDLKLLKAHLTVAWPPDRATESGQNQVVHLRPQQADNKMSGDASSTNLELLTIDESTNLECLTTDRGYKFGAVWDTAVSWLRRFTSIFSVTASVSEVRMTVQRVVDVVVYLFKTPESQA